MIHPPVALSRRRHVTPGRQSKLSAQEARFEALLRRLGLHCRRWKDGAYWRGVAEVSWEASRCEQQVIAGRQRTPAGISGAPGPVGPAARLALFSEPTDALACFTDQGACGAA